MKLSQGRLTLAAGFVIASLGHSAMAVGAMDEENLHGGGLTKSTAIHIHPFDTSRADLGSPKFRDTATAMAKSAPHLLATDIVATLRDAA